MGWIGYISIVGFAAAGTAGVSHTGGNLYEEMRPTVLKRKEKEGYKFVPVEPPGERKPSSNEGTVKFSWASGGCFKRLFPGVEVVHNIPEEKDKADKPSPKPFSSTEPESYQNYIGCTTMDMSPWGNENKHLYYKSETVIKNDKVGIAIGTGLSTGDKESGKSSTAFDLFYRLIFLQKDGADGKIQRGYRWIPTTLEGTATNEDGSQKTDKYYIKTPGGYWIEGLEKKDGPNPITEKSGSGVWEFVESKENEPTEGSHPGKEIEVHTYLNDTPEQFFGSDDPFTHESNDTPGALGGSGVTVGYEPNSGGKELKNLDSPYDATTELKSGYAPFKEQKGKWSELKTRCEEISKNRATNINFPQELMNLCFKSADQKSAQ